MRVRVRVRVTVTAFALAIVGSVSRNIKSPKKFEF